MENDRSSPEQSSEAFISLANDPKSLEVAVIHFHRVVRPRLARRYSRLDWIEFADLAAEVELRLLQRLRRATVRWDVRSIWSDAVPSFIAAVARALKLRRRPAVRGKRQVSAVLLSGSLGEELSARQLREATARLSEVCFQGASNSRLREQCTTDDGLVRITRELVRVGIDTSKKARLALCHEVAITGDRGASATVFQTRGEWEAYCCKVARSVMIDEYRRNQRDNRVELRPWL